MLRRLMAVWLLVGVGGSLAPAQPVQGTVRTVGFRTPGQTGFMVRQGQWMPILVELNAAGNEHQEVILRCEQPDLDGDHVAYLSQRVTLTGGGGPARRVWCYAAYLPDRSGQVRLDVLSAEGVLLHRLNLPPFEILYNDQLLLLDISEQPVTKLRSIGGQQSFEDRRYYRHVVVGQMPAAELPDRWWGLEAVDVIVWDEPSFDTKTISASQLEALMGWVRKGGELVVGLGASWAQVRKSALADILPVRGDAAPVAARELENFFRNLAAPTATEFPAPITVAPVQAVGEAVVFRDRLSRGARPFALITTDLVGSGRVTVVATSLRELTSVPLKLSGPANTPALFLKLLDLNPNTREFLESEAEVRGYRQATRLYSSLVQPIEFRQIGGLLMLAAVAFVVIYMGLSTLASWTWLRRRGLTRMSWTVFAGLAVLASAVSVGAVGLTRGVFGRVDALSLIDFEGGSSAAQGVCLFGYRSPRRQRVELSLPGEDDYLRPLARGPEGTSEYATPERYAAVPTGATLQDVLMRATLKQFEGYWSGALDGTIRAQLVADRRTGQITENSWIKNDLNVDVSDGYLLYVDPRLPGPVDRAAGYTAAHRPKYKGADSVPPAINVLAVRLGPIKIGEQRRGIGATEYAEYERVWQQWNLRDPQDQNPKREPDDLLTLWHRQRQWVDDASLRIGLSRSGHDETASAALLISTRSFYLPSTKEFDEYGKEIGTFGLVDSDVSHWLLRGRAVLLLLADDPGPAELYRDGKPMSSKRGRSLYRVRVSLQETGQAGRGSTP